MDIAASYPPTTTDPPARLATVIGNVAVGAVLAVTAAALIAYPILALNWVANPQLTGLIGPTQIIDAAELVFSTPWDGTAHGFDVLVEVGGVALPEDPWAAQARLREIVAAQEPGAEVPVVVERLVNSPMDAAMAPAGFACALGADAQTFPADAACTFAARVDYFPAGAFITWFGIPYLVGVAVYAAGLLVLLRRRHKLTARLFAVMCASLAISTAGLLDNYSTHSLVPLWTAAVPLTGSMLGMLALTFPYNLGVVRRLHLKPVGKLPVSMGAVVALSPLALGALVALYALAVLYSPGRRSCFVGWVIALLFTGMSFLTFMAVCLRRRVRTSSYLERAQCGAALVGGFLSVSPLVVLTIGLLVEALFNTPPLNLSVAAVTPFLLIFPATLAHVMLWRRPLNTDVIVSRGTAYAILGVALVTGYAMLTAGLSLVIGSAIRADNPILIGLMVTLIAFLVLPFRHRLEAIVDAVYYRTRITYQRHLEAFGREITQAFDLDAVVDTLEQTLDSALAPAHFYVYMYDPTTNHYLAHGNPRPGSDVRFAADGSVVNLLNGKLKVLHIRSDQPLPPELITDSARLRVLRAQVLAALRGQGRMSGFIVLGPKRSGEPYGFEDMRFIEDLADQAALGVERAQVITDLERRVSELNVLSRVSQAVNFTIEFGDLLELIYAQTSKVLDTTNFFIALHDAAAQELYHAFYIRDDERLPDREGERWRLGRGLLSEVVRTGQPIRTDDYMTECAKRDVRPREQGFRAWMGVPLNAGASTLGAMAVASTKPGFTYTDDQLKVFWAIADTAATAIDKSRLFTTTEERARQLAALNQISTRLAKIQDVDELLRLILDSAVDILQAESGSLLLVDEETDGLEFRVATGQVGALLVGTKLPRGTGVVGTVAERGEPIIVNDVRHDPRWFAGVDRDTEFRTEALLAVPLIVHNDVIGVLEVVNKRDGSIFTEEDVRLLSTFAAQASIAIDNTRLYQQTNEALSARVEELKMLSRIDRELNAGLDLDRIVELTLDWAMRVSGANAGVIASYDPEQGLNVLLHYGYGPEANAILNGSLPADRGIFGRAIRSGAPELVTKVTLDPDYMPISLNTKAQMVVPLRSGGEVVGVIILDSFSDSVFSEPDMEFVIRVAEHASPALTNARLFADLRAANEAKSDIMSVVSHELKTPMTSIKGYTDLLLQGAVGDVSQTQHQFLSIIRSNVERMEALVSDLAYITRIEAGKLPLEMSPIPVRAVIEDTLRGVQRQIEDKNQHLHLQVPDDLPLIYGDQTRLVQVLTNFLTNAHKYSPEGGTITVGAETSENLWDPKGPDVVMHLWVKDTGIGISEDDQRKLFTKFFRSTNLQATQMPGTGLGLTIAKNLIELHGGTVWVESALGVGSTFHFTVPLAVAAVPAD